MAKNKKQKNKAKSKSSKLVYLIIILFLCVYIPSIYNLVYGKCINTAFISIGEIEDSINTTGYLIRNESVIAAPFSGNCITDVSEGEKIQAKSRIAKVLKNSDENLINKIREIDFDILEAQRNKQENKEIFLSDILKLDKEIEKKLAIFIEDGNKANYSNYKKIKSEIDSLIYKKNTIIGETDTKDSYINSKKMEKEKIQRKLNSSVREIYSESSGIVSYCVDGFEELLKPSNIKELNCDFFENAHLKNIKKDYEDIVIVAQKPFAKIIKGMDAYIAVVIEGEYIQKYSEGDSVKIRFNDIDKLVDGIIKNKIEEKNKKALIIVEVNKALQYLSEYRVVNIDLITNSYNGYKVPLKSLKEYNKTNKTAKIGVLKANKVIFKDINVLGENMEFAIIENQQLDFGGKIKLYDKFVVNPENIFEGQFINSDG